VPRTIDITFVEQTQTDDGPDIPNLSFISGMWGMTMGLLPGHSSIYAPDYTDSDKDINQASSDWLRREIENKLNPGDCIDKMIFRGHGNQSQIGGLHARQTMSNNQNSPQHKLLEWMKTKRCSECSTIEVKSCYAANGEEGLGQIVRLSVTSGYRVRAYDDRYAIVGWGNEWMAYPDGSAPVIVNPGIPMPMIE